MSRTPSRRKNDAAGDQCTRAWTPVDRSAVSKLRLPTQQKGQTTSLMISTTARLLRAAAMAVARARARIVSY